MLIQDMVKLVYQNEFGAGHFVRSESDSLERLKAECATLSSGQEDEAFEDIGNDLCRLHLAGAHRLLSLATINRLFVHTATFVTGSQVEFEGKLGVLRQLCQDSLLPYSLPQIDQYLAQYKALGYPAVSHSALYRKLYRPAYRVVRAAFRHYHALCSRLDQLLASRQTVTLAIDGNCASGKSTLAALLAEIYDCNVFHMDDFFLPEIRKTKSRLSEAGGNVDYERFQAEVLAGLRSGDKFIYRPFNCMSQELTGAVEVSPKQLNIIEGAYSLHPSLSASYDLKVFLSIDSALQSQRILERNGHRMHRRFVEEWIPLENRYFAESRTREGCDLVFEAKADGTTDLTFQSRP